MAVNERLPGNRRVTGSEQYYTPVDLAEELVGATWEVLQDAAPQSNPAERTFIEPAGGTGAFVTALRARGASRVISVDTDPQHPGVQQADFLQWLPGRVSDAVTISNPPFGRNNKLSVRFFNHAAEFSETIAFVVPRSWRKWSVINRLDPRFQLVSDVDLAIRYVDVNGEALTEQNHLRTAFQIWRRGRAERPKFVVEDRGWVSKTSRAEATHSLTTFGYGCGRVRLRAEFASTPKSTDIYLRIEDSAVATALTQLDYQRFSNHTAYTQAISLQEINYLLNEYLTGDAGLREVSWTK